MNYITLNVKGEEYKLKATTGAKIEAEKMLGGSLLSAFDKFAQSNAVSIVLWAALQSLNHGMKMHDVYELVDDMEEDGFVLDGKHYESFSAEEKGLLIYEILKVSGFFTKAQMAELDRDVKSVFEAAAPLKKMRKKAEKESQEAQLN